MPDGKPGLSWNGKHGVVGINGVGKDIVIDGMNEKRRQFGLFYHPGTAEYQTYDPGQGQPITASDRRWNVQEPLEGPKRSILALKEIIHYR